MPHLRYQETPKTAVRLGYGLPVAYEIPGNHMLV